MPQPPIRLKILPAGEERSAKDLFTQAVAFGLSYSSGFSSSKSL
jgi:hypothetical protein